MSAFEPERLLLAAWPARETMSLDGWSLLTDGGVTGRPNAVSPLAFHGKLGEAISAVQAHYTARRMRPTFRIARGACAPGDLPEQLIARGWAPSQQTLVMTASLADTLSALPPAGDRVVLSETYPEAVDAILRETSTSPAEYEERRGLAQRTPRPRAFAVIGEGEAEAVGLCVIVEKQAAIFLMRTHPAHRRKGLARRVLAALLAWAHDQGATGAFLQVEADNVAAVALYAASAFKSVYSYDYWREEHG